MRHKHHKEIKAWADGAEIEWTYSGTIWQQTNIPSWFEDYKYRVKPAEPVYEWVWVYSIKQQGYLMTEYYLTKQAAEFYFRGKGTYEAVEMSKRERK